MSMYRIRHGKKRWRTNWPWRWLYPLKLDERFCRKCGLPYHNGPLPKEIQRFDVGNVGALIFPAGGWKKGNRYSIRFGRWKQGSRDFSFSEYIPCDELDELRQVLDQVVAFLAASQKPRAKRS